LSEAKPNKHRQMRYRRMKLEGASYFFTLVTEHRQPLFRNAAVVRLFQNAVAEVRARHPFALQGQVILPDHLHALWTLPDGDAAYSTRWRLIKSSFTRALLRNQTAAVPSESRRSKAEQAVWQRRFWEHLIRDDSDFAAHLDYIHFNPVRHGLAAAPRDWPYSTFREWVARGIYDPDWGSSVPPELPDWAGRE
jgi:putative transposase